MEKKRVSAKSARPLPQLYVKLENIDALIGKTIRKNRNLLRKSSLPKGRSKTEVSKDSPHSHLESLMNADSTYVKQEKEYMAAIARLNYGYSVNNIKPEPGLIIEISSSSSSSSSYKSFEEANLSPPSSPCYTIKQEPSSPDCSVSEFPSESSNPDSDCFASSEKYSNSSSQATTVSSSTFPVRTNAVNSTSAKPLNKKSSPSRTIKQEPSYSERDSSASQSKSSHSSSANSSKSKPQQSERMEFLRSEVLGNPMFKTLFKDLFDLKRQYDNIDEESIKSEVQAMKKRNKLPP